MTGPRNASDVELRLSQVNVSTCCVDIDSTPPAKRGVMDRIEASGTRRGSSLFSLDESPALEYAGALTVAAPGASEELWGRLKQHWSNELIVKPAGPIAFENLSSKFGAALDAPARFSCSAPADTGVPRVAS